MRENHYGGGNRRELVSEAAEIEHAPHTFAHTEHCFVCLSNN
jgi:hypothetical protein